MVATIIAMADRLQTITDPAPEQSRSKELAEPPYSKVGVNEGDLSSQKRLITGVILAPILNGTVASTKPKNKK
jgi:hypothetical protein